MPILRPRCFAIAKRLAAKAPEAVMISKRLMRNRAAAVLAHTDEELISFKARLSSPEATEAFQAFLEKRPADFAKLKS